MLSDALGLKTPRASFVSRQSQTADRLRVQELENCYESKSDIRKKNEIANRKYCCSDRKY